MKNPGSCGLAPSKDLAPIFFVVVVSEISLLLKKKSKIICKKNN